MSASAGTSIPSPLRILGLARILAGAWFISRGAATLRQYPDFVPQLERLFGGDVGATDAPVRALLVLVTAAGLVLVGLVLAAKGIPWLRRLVLPPAGPMALARDEVVATLRHHQLLSFAVRGTEPRWPFRRLVSDELAEMPGWRRNLIDRGVRAFVRSCGLVLGLAALWLVLPFVTSDAVLGPFPASFVPVLLFVTAIWAALVLMVIAPDGLRIESDELPLPAGAGSTPALRAEQVIESSPLLLDREPPGLGLTLGLVGVAAQCLMLWWWDLSPIGFPLLATSIIRHSGSIAGGVLFFVMGDRMLMAAAELLLRFRYESLLILIDNASDGMVARAAAIRTESRGLAGSRHILAAVGGPHVRDSALATVSMAGHTT